MKNWGLAFVILSLCIFVFYGQYYQGKNKQEQALAQSNAEPYSNVLYEHETPKISEIKVKPWLTIERCSPVVLDDKLVIDDWLLALQNQDKQSHWHEYLAQLDTCLHHYVQSYMDYKRALQEVDDNLNIFERNTLLKALQLEYFSPQTIALWFEEENQWNEQALQRWRILADRRLSEQQQQQLIEQHISQLPEQERQLIQSSSRLHQLAENWQQQDFNRLSSQYGEAAAQRIIELQKKTRQWQSKLTKFKKLRAKIAAKALTSAHKVSAIEKLKQSLFDVNEQKRLSIALTELENSH
ncbi:Lipase chaperone [Pseudoalteromonas holothuriae]|uniref:Lipase chaperone n=1 Tax=Pseudoalteromonas holothuriae TaxID=2963714 RepID=A0ABM9GDS9_9GAMM|nr:lipase chaperone family protein [Pseudoalteromonas sp. CIP111951]CAH9050856.1 Lipase chaperone [Pseudoalteromonas sp. CIP111951]